MTNVIGLDCVKTTPSIEMQIPKDGRGEDSYSSSEADSNSEEGAESESCPNRGLPAILRHVGDDLDLLAQIAVLVMRPGFKRRYLHSTRLGELDPKMEPFAKFDRLSVEEKIIHWKAQDTQQNGNEATATPELVESRALAREPLEGEHVLLQRLAMANTRRREQFLHWSRDPDEVKEIGQEVDNAKIQARGHAPRSTLSKDTYSIVDETVVLETNAKVNSEGTTYSESTAGNTRSNRVPDAPAKIWTDATFECPYCHLTLESLKMQNRGEWK